MKKLKYLLLIFIIFLTPNVFAASQNISQKIEATPNFGGGTYYATQPVSVPVPLYQNVGTRYNGKLSLIEFYLDNTDWSWNYNKTYTITLNMATEDWRNNFMGPQVIQCNCDGSQQSTSTSKYVSNTFRFVSYKTIKFNFKLGSTMGCKTKFRIYSTNTSNTAITGVSNYNLSSIVISDTTTPPTPTPVFPSPTVTPAPNNQDIINNQNQNTQDIIDNNTQNTSDIIENNNQNTETLNESINSNCKDTQINLSYDYAMTTGKILTSTGSELDLSGGAISVYFQIKPNTTYTVGTLASSLPNNFYYCLYSATKGVLSCSTLNSSGETTISTNGYASYLRISMYNYRQLFLSGPICNNWEKEGLQNIADSINQTNQYLTDNSNPSVSDNEFLNMFNSIGVNDPLNYLLTLPTQLINKMVSLSGSCAPIELGTLYGTQLTLPCINLQNILGSTVWNIIDVIFSVSLLVVIFKNLYDTFANLITMGAQKEAKEKFSMPTPMDFLSMILGGDK